MPDDVLIAILAAGASQRLGQPKQLVDVNGEPLIRRQGRVAIESGVGPVAVICGCHAEVCASRIEDLPLAIRRNDQWAEGIASSIREATQAAIEHNAVAVLILHVDQYRITAKNLQDLHAAWTRGAASGRSIVCRSKDGSYAGPPVVLPRSLFGKMMQLRGEEGARSLISNLSDDARVDMVIPNAGYDLDTPAQVAAIDQNTALGMRKQ